MLQRLSHGDHIVFQLAGRIVTDARHEVDLMFDEDKGRVLGSFSSELWEKMVSQFGRQGTVQLMMIMGDYFRVGFMLNAVDQHLPPGREELLPPLKR